MPIRLLEHLRRHEPIMRKIIGGDLAVFVKTVSSNMSYVERRTSPDEAMQLQGEDLLYASKKLTL